MSLLLKIILLVITVVLFFALGIYKKENSYDDYGFKFNKKQFLALIPAVIWAASLFVAIVPANTVGVKYSRLNGTSNKTLDEGIHLITPLDKVYEIDTTVQERTVKNVSVQTQDAQFVKMEINVKYQVSQDNAFKVYKGYKNLDNLNKNIVANYSQEALNEVCTQYNVIDVLGDKRTEILNKATEILNKKFENEGVTLKALVLKDIDAGTEIEDAIKNEAVAKKEAETAEQKKIKAQKDAETKVIEAQGEADANAAKTSQLTDQILKEKFIEKWNGELPKVTGDNGSMFDISSLLGE